MIWHFFVSSYVKTGLYVRTDSTSSRPSLMAMISILLESSKLAGPEKDRMKVPISSFFTPPIFLCRSSQFPEGLVWFFIFYFVLHRNSLIFITGCWTSTSKQCVKLKCLTWYCRMSFSHGLGKLWQKYNLLTGILRFCNKSRMIRHTTSWGEG